ncbi:MAG: hypothetical protein IIC83_01075, partial [Chloroflexi bacterium]|nr:hypothetical protein [Chloroflexota bacterium]
MINIKRISLYILLSVLPAVALFASGNSTAVAQEPAISVELKPSNLHLNEELEIIVRVVGTGEVSLPTLPEIDGLSSL